MNLERRSDISGPYGDLVAKPWTLADLLRLPRFFLEVHKRGKHRELASFIVWELKHRLGLFGRNEYVEIRDEPSATLDLTGLDAPDVVALSGRVAHLSISRAEHAWKVAFSDCNGGLWGSALQDDCTLYVSHDGGRTAHPVCQFSGEIKSVFVSSRNTIFVCILGEIFRSSDDGKHFHISLNLSSKVSFSLLNNGMTETPNQTLIVGEYGSLWKAERWVSLANMYYSNDEGASWKTCDFLIRRGINKHVHLVKYSTVLDRVVLTDGDNQKNIWLSNVDDLLAQPEEWAKVNRSHIHVGGYTSMAETDEHVLLGTDYLGGTNFLVQSRDGKAWKRRVIPDPYRRNPILNMVTRRSTTGIETWALLHSSMFASTRCLLMYSVDGGESWRRFIEYDGRACELRLLSSSARPQSSVYFSITDSTAANGRSHCYQIGDA